MKRFLAILSALLAIMGCGNQNGKISVSDEISNNSEIFDTDEMVYNGEIGYADIVSYIVQGYQCRWNDMDLTGHGFSLAYLACSPDCGYAEVDINGDGIKELLIGKCNENGSYMLFDMWTINPEDGSLFHLASGDDRDWFVINGDGVIIETVDNLRGSYSKGWQIEGNQLVKMKSDAWHDSLMSFELNKFSEMIKDEQLAGGYTQMRKPTEEEVTMFKMATDDDGMIIYTPLYVSTQVVAGLNYRFWCIWDDLGSDLKEYKEPTNSYGYCLVTIFKPLPGQGEARVSDVDNLLMD